MFSLGYSPIDIVALEKELSSYPVEDVKLELLNGFKNGFSLHYTGPRVQREAKNLQSALQFPHIVTAKLQKEIDAKRMAGPFPCPPFPNFRVSPIGVVAKKHNPAGEEADNYRLIHHLSYPKDDGVNHRAVTINRSGDYRNSVATIRFTIHVRVLSIRFSYYILKGK